MVTKTSSFFHFSLCHKCINTNRIYSCTLPNFEQNSSGRLRHESLLNYHVCTTFVANTSICELHFNAVYCTHSKNFARKSQMIVRTALYSPLVRQLIHLLIINYTPHLEQLLTRIERCKMRTNTARPIQLNSTAALAFQLC